MSTASIFYPRTTLREGVIVGYSFENQTFLIVDIVSSSVEETQAKLGQPKFSKFESVAEIMVLGVLTREAKHEHFKKS